MRVKHKLAIMKNKGRFILIGLLIWSGFCNSQTISVNEQKNIDLFNEFKNYLMSSLAVNKNITDQACLKYIALHYLVTKKNLDSSNQATISDKELSPGQLESFKSELNSFYSFLRENEKSHLAENLTITPIRLSKDTFVYNRLTSFQKQNTFVLFDKRSPGKTISYILFLPPIKNKTDQPRIWSWTLLFKFGKLMFASVTGEEGYEYIFSPEQFAK